MPGCAQKWPNVSHVCHGAIHEADGASYNSIRIALYTHNGNGWACCSLRVGGGRARASARVCGGGGGLLGPESAALCEWEACMQLAHQEPSRPCWAHFIWVELPLCKSWYCGGSLAQHLRLTPPSGQIMLECLAHTVASCLTSHPAGQQNSSCCRRVICDVDQATADQAIRPHQQRVIITWRSPLQFNTYLGALSARTGCGVAQGGITKNIFNFSRKGRGPRWDAASRVHQCAGSAAPSAWCHGPVRVGPSQWGDHWDTCPAG